MPIGTRPARSGPHRLKLVGILGRYTTRDSRSRRRAALPFAGKRLVLGQLVPGRRLGMDAQSTHALELDHGEQELSGIPRAARAGHGRLELEVPGLAPGGLELGGRRGTAETRHFCTIRSLL